MLAIRGILAPAHALVHPRAAETAAEADRHAAFLAHTLALAFSACAAAPFLLAFQGAPTPAEIAIFALALVQIGAAMLVARTGRLALGHRLSALALVAVSVTLFVGMRSGAGVAFAWLVAAQLEASASLDRRVAREASLVTGTTLIAILAASLADLVPTRLPESGAAVMAGLAVVACASAARRMTAVVADLQAAQTTRDARSRAIDAALGSTILTLDAGGSVSALARPDNGFFGGPDQEIVGRGLFDRVHVGDRPAFLKLINDAAHGPDTTVGTFRLRAFAAEAGRAGLAEPRHLTIEMRAHSLSPARDVVAVLRDITDQHDRGLEIEAAQRSVEETMANKDIFLTTMRHELRTPLNSIIGFSEILASRTARPDDIAKQCEYARLISQSGHHLLGIVNAVLDMSKIQLGTFPINAEPFDMAALLDQACEAVAAKAREGQVRLARDFPATLEEIVGDRTALKLALLNVLTNAVKFTPERGQVTLTARPEGTALVIIITDTGIGIAPEDLPRIGDPFFQARATFARTHEGSGLGLSLVRGLVGLHGGTLTIESEAGRGTAVTIRLPLDCRAIVRKAADAAIEAVPRRQPRPRPLNRVKDAA